MIAERELEAPPEQRRTPTAVRARFLLPTIHRLRHFLEKVLDVRLGVLQHHAPRPVCLPDHYSRPARRESTLAFTIVTPSFNQGRFLEQTIQSVLSQDYPRLQYIVQDGGSSDETPAILDRYQDRLDHCVSAPDNGQAHAINLGFDRATGDVMGWLNSDDMLLPGALHYVADYLDRHPEVDAVYGHRILVDEQGQEINRWVMPPHSDSILSWVDYIPQETLFWRRSLWDRVGASLDETFNCALDWDLLLRFRDAGARIRRLPRFLGAFRVTSTQKTLSLASRCAAEMRYLLQRCHGRPVPNREQYRHLVGYLLRHVVCHQLFRLGVFRY